MSSDVLANIKNAFVQAADKTRNIARSVKNSTIPSNIRIYSSHLGGGRTAITEKDLSKADIDAILYAIQKNIAETKNSNQGVIGYGDYGPSGISSFGAPDENILSPIYNSYIDPAYRMETTLGMARWRRLPDGSYIVEDRYNFNATRPQVKNALTKQGSVYGVMSDAYGKKGISGVLNAIGNIYGDTETERGNPVRIRIKPSR